MNDKTWTPSYTFGERLKYGLIPARLNMWRLVRKNLRKGEAELRFLPHLVPPDKIAVDVGANKGVYTHLLSKLCAHVESFEPNPKMFAIFNRALRDNVTAHQVALSNKDGEAELIIPGREGKFSNQRASLSELHRAKENAVVRVQTRTLDSYDLRNVGFIKIDVEGFEQSVLQGAARTLERERPVLLMEMEEQHTGQPLEQSIAAVVARGYEVFFLRDGQLRPVGELDKARNRTLVAKPGYVNNFIAKPINSRG